MATKPTIYKAHIDLSDTDRKVYEALNLTLARHPSETLERMLVRLLAYCFNAREGLQFGKGISDSDEADLWAHSLDGVLELWIDVGEPAVERIRKASRIARGVRVYSFNSKAATWWSQNQKQFAELDVAVYRLEWKAVQALASQLGRNIDLSVSISGGSAFVATAGGEYELQAEPLQEP